jgi:hypothetical protein
MPAIRVAAMPQLVAQHFILDWIGYEKMDIIIMTFL